jgi:hypothetical protein
MELDIIILLVMAILGPVMIFLTHYIVKGRGKDMTRLWFITFISFIVYYMLVKSNYINDPRGIVYGYALLWPIAAILAFWIVEKLTAKEASPIPFFRYMVYFLVAVIFAFVLDGIGGIMNWYTYNSSVLDKTAMVNPISGLQVPAVVPFLMGIIMIGVFLLTFNVHKIIRSRRIDDTSATLLLSALAVVMSGFVWGATEVIVSVVRSLL